MLDPEGSKGLGREVVLDPPLALLVPVVLLAGKGWAERLLAVVAVLPAGKGWAEPALALAVAGQPVERDWAEPVLALALQDRHCHPPEALRRCLCFRLRHWAGRQQPDPEAGWFDP